MHFRIVYSFSGGADGREPDADLFRDAAGNLFGTTRNGGDTRLCPVGCGVVFELDPNGKETLVHTFSHEDGNGLHPVVGLVQDTRGNFYGATPLGGGNNDGVIFKIDQNGDYSVLHRFSGADGSEPTRGLTFDAAGNLYGTTRYGGSSCNCGVVYRLDSNGKEIVIHKFHVADGRNPKAGVIRDAAGDLYGTTSDGGANGLGVVYKINPSGTEQVLHNFDNSDGAIPGSGLLIRDKAGNLYGTTSSGGAYLEGTVYKVGPNGGETTLHSFKGPDGADPFAGLIRDSAGDFFGTTVLGGNLDCGGIGCGVVFELDRSGNESVLHAFTGGDGFFPFAGLTPGAAGKLYGATSNDDGITSGVVFELSP
ncbi:MAG TPA: choice-of-anchor tandem repeat GloVer-containing protein [Candidatus Eremiobacteraceae bacterium]|nr:choice-of-anchor tandem repeat GloVer-containing protein [Candidatus Eremiobacteraceae bacterium]